MSWRHAAPARDTTTMINAETAEHAEQDDLSADSASSAFNVVPLVRNGRDLARIERLEELPPRFDVELRIPRLDAEEEAIAARQCEARHVEHRVIWLREPVQRQHPEH